MRLSELEPELLNTEGGKALYFICPQCGKHSLRVPVAPEQGAHIWKAESMDDLERITVSPSIDAKSPPLCRAHFWIRNGEIVFA